MSKDIPRNDSMKIKDKYQFIFSLVLILNSLVEFWFYHANDCVYRMPRGGMVCGEEAVYYYYLYIGVLIVGLILLITSSRKKKGKEKL